MVLVLKFTHTEEHTLRFISPHISSAARQVVSAAEIFITYIEVKLTAPPTAVENTASLAAQETVEEQTSRRHLTTR